MTSIPMAENDINRARLPQHNPRGGLNALGSLSTIAPLSHSPAVPLSNSYLQPYSATPRTMPLQNPPPLPPRRAAGYPASYSRYPAGYGMGSGYYPGYNRFASPYGGYRMPYGPYGGSHTENYNSFIQMAEESTRPAFESIESVVEVVSSISMMLESTYHAVHSSYSAILGVVDQFSRLKDHLAQMLSVLALYRGLRWLCLKFLYLIRLRKENPSVEAAWNAAQQLSNSSAGGKQPVGSAWPFLMFVSLVVGAPWLMFKLLSKSVPKQEGELAGPSDFVDDRGRRFCSYGAYDFIGGGRNELSFKAGEKLFLSPKDYRNNQGWILACNERNETGYIPCNYLGRPKSNANSAAPGAVVPQRAAATSSAPNNASAVGRNTVQPPVKTLVFKQRASATSSANVVDETTVQPPVATIPQRASATSNAPSSSPAVDGTTIQPPMTTLVDVPEPAISTKTTDDCN